MEAIRQFFARLTWVEYVALIALLRGVFIGYRSGLFTELLRTATYLVTLVFTFRYYTALADQLTLKTFLDYSTAKAASFAILLVAVFIAARTIMAFFVKFLKVGEGNVALKFIGAAVGAGRWIVILSLVFNLITYSSLTNLRTDIRTRSILGQEIAELAPQLFDHLSASAGLTPPAEGTVPQELYDS